MLPPLPFATSPAAPLARRSGMSAAAHVQTAVIGGGVVGLACARALARAGREVLILERAGGIGTGTSSRNSEVVHAGIYYTQPTSHKAVFCVEGKRLLYEYCEERGVPFMNCGKLVVATTAEQLRADLPRIVASAAKNGVDDLRILTPEDVARIEPDVACHGAIWSPSTGIVDSHTFMVHLLGDAEDAGACLALQSAVDAVDVAADGRVSLSAGGTHLVCDEVVNCGGLHAGHIAEMMLASRDARRGTRAPRAPLQYYAKGNYYKLEGQRSPFACLVYPVPVVGGLGVHATIDLAGATKFGPDVEWVPADATDPDAIDLTPCPRRADAFYDEVRRYWPGLRDGCLAPDYAGVRPKLTHPSVHGAGPAADFRIETESEHGVAGFVNLLGIESPGLTSSLAIAQHVQRALCAA